MQFSNKAHTLSKIKCQNAIVPNLLIIKTKDYKKNNNKILKQILKKFRKYKYIAVRSSSSKEDTNKQSFAGHFKTVLNVGKNFKEINSAIQQVIGSYNNQKNSIFFVQEMVEDCDFSGVITTCNLSNKAPYYVINYYKGNDTSATTSGKANTKNYFQFKYYKKKGKQEFQKIIKLAKELEKKFQNNYLDIEFGYKSGKLYLFQVRPLVINIKDQFKQETYEKALSKLEKKINKLKKKHYNLIGNSTYFGVMPDWNPAEIIGIKPGYLSISLYQELITDFIWAKNRNSYGFSDMTAFHLMTIFLGTPFIDVRVDFNSWLPKNLGSNLKKKLITYYLDKFKKNTNYHDKIEFEILFTCYNAKTNKKLQNIKKKYLNNLDKKILIKELKSINHKAFNKIDKEIEKINILKLKQSEISKSNLYSIDKIYWLIEDCKRYGTEPFAGLARSGFIAIEILNSFVESKILLKSEMQNFMRSINTIASDIIKDKKLPKKKFCEKYGHLRPNTYDILSQNYKENYKSLFAGNNLKIRKPINFNISHSSKLKLDKFLSSNFKNYNVSSFLSTLKKAIEYREYSKFVFTKNIDMIFNELKYLSKRFNIKIKDLSNLNIKVVKELYYNLNNRDIKNILLQDIKKNIKDFEINRLIELPQVIIDTKDIYFFEQEMNSPNFFGNKKVEKKIVFLNNKSKNLNLNDKIICISSADPGYDFIFNYNIGGLITEYGGANSHMSIRCAELNIPAAIGVGKIIFSDLLKSNKICLDPNLKKVTIL